MFKSMYSLNLFDKSKNMLLMSPTTPKHLVTTCKNLGYQACCIMDYHSLSGIVEFASECKTANIKSIIGCQFFSKEGFYSLIAKNRIGLNNLIKLVSRSHDSDYYDNGPNVTLDLIEEHAEGLILVTGGLNSNLAYNICKFDEVYDESSIDRVKSLLNIDTSIIERYKSIFKNDLYLEYYNYRMPFNEILTSVVKDLSEKYKVPLLFKNNSHYCQDQATSFTTVLSMGLKTTVDQLVPELRLHENAHLIPVMDDYIIPSKDLDRLYETCESYSFFQNPQLPHFTCPNNIKEIDYLKQLCRNGWARKNKNWSSVYVDRVKYELNVIEQANLAGYFLIVSDYTKWAKDNKILVGPGRGSAGGSLVAYLTDIIEIDPIKYDLIFERFFNVGRVNELPDIDSDFPIQDREKVIDYIRQKYGEEYTAQVSTFGRMMGASVLKEVFRVYKVCSFEQANRITKDFIPEAKIAGDLEEMEKNDEEYSIIKWMLENKPETLVNYCIYDGEYKGDYGKYFEHAVNLEGVCKNQGKHAAAIVISPIKLRDICPMIHDKTANHKITGLDMEGLKKIGLTKWDILGVGSLDSCQNISRLV